jgi:hypothetical protein
MVPFAIRYKHNVKTNIIGTDLDFTVRTTFDSYDVHVPIIQKLL